MRSLLYLFVFLALTGASLLDNTVKLRYFTVEHEDNAFAIAWESEEEQDVASYELYRKTSFAVEFVQIGTADPHGIDKAYTIQDDQVYKAASEQVDYRLEVVFNDGVRQLLAEKKVNYTPTAIRRSWGSIKAMFQF